MKRVNVIQCYDGFCSDKGWVPVMVTDTREEADRWIEDEIKRDQKNETRGLSYRITPSKRIAR